MRLTASGAYLRPTPVPKMPPGLVELMEGLTREVLKHNPPDVYEFCANHMQSLLEIRDGPVKKRPLTLEEKIARAQKKVRERAEQRRRKYDKEMESRSCVENDQNTATLSNEDEAENKHVEKLEKEIERTASILESSHKAPVHHEQDLTKALEVEIYHQSRGDIENVTPETVESKVVETEDVSVIKRVEQEIHNEDTLTGNPYATAFESTVSDGLMENNKSLNVDENVIKKNEEASVVNVSNTSNGNAEIINDSNSNDESKIKLSSVNGNEKDEKVSFDNARISNKSDENDISIDSNPKGETKTKSLSVDENIIQKDEKASINDVRQTNTSDGNNDSNLQDENETKSFDENVDEGSIDIVKQSEARDENELIFSNTKDKFETIQSAKEKELMNVEAFEQEFDHDKNALQDGYEGKTHKSPKSTTEIQNAEPLTNDDDDNDQCKKDEESEENVDLKNGYENSKTFKELVLIESNNTCSETLIIDNNAENDDTEITFNEIKSEIDKIEKDILDEVEHVEISDSQSGKVGARIQLHCEKSQNTESEIKENCAKENLYDKNILSNTATEQEDTSDSVHTENTDGTITEDKVLVIQHADVKDDNTSVPAQSLEDNITERNDLEINLTYTPVSEDTSKDNSFEGKSERRDESETENLDQERPKRDLENISEGIEIASNNITDVSKSEYETVYSEKSSSVEDSATEEGNDSTIESDTQTENKTTTRANSTGMDLETAAVTIQKVFRTFLFKSRASTFEGSVNDDPNLTDEDNEKGDLEFLVPNANMNKERRGICRMDTVLQTVNEEKSLSLSTDDSSLSSAATVIQAHVRGFLVRNRVNSTKTVSLTSFVNSNDPPTSDPDPEQTKINKTVLNIIVPEGGHFISRDESMLTSIELSLDGSPPSSINLHPLGYDKSEPRKQLKREDAIQSVSPPSNNSGKLSEDVDSVKEIVASNSTGQKIDETKIDADRDSRDDTPTKSTTVESVVEVHKKTTEIKDPSIPEHIDQTISRKGTLTKMSSDESDVVTPFEEKYSTDFDSTSGLLHSGEFHDVVLPTKVSRNNTSVVREFKNVLVYFLIWNNS